MKKILFALALLLGPLTPAIAAQGPFVGYLVNEPGLAYNHTYTLDINSFGIRTLSAQANYSSATFVSASFADGAQSTGSVTVAAPLALSSASATEQVTVLSTSGLAGATLRFTRGPSTVLLREGVDWRRQATTTATAANLAAALAAALPSYGFSSSTQSAIIYSTAPSPGPLYNATSVVSSTPTALSVATPNFSGGRDNAVLTVNGVPLRQGLDWNVGSTSATAATSIAAAINSNSRLSPYLSATANSPSSGIVALLSTGVGASRNFSLASSTQAALSPSGAAMTGGQDAAYALGSPLFRLPGHGFTLALPLLYSQGASPAVGGLADQTTYYAIPVDANTVALATTSARAVAGAPLVVSSSNTQTSPHSYGLAPLPIAGTPGFKWQGSNDNQNFFDLAVASVTVSSYSSPPAVTNWDFGAFPYAFLRLNVTAPTAGGLFLQVPVTSHQ